MAQMVDLVVKVITNQYKLNAYQAERAEMLTRLLVEMHNIFQVAVAVAVVVKEELQQDKQVD
jgi:hypothetical protein